MEQIDVHQTLLTASDYLAAYGLRLAAALATFVKNLIYFTLLIFIIIASLGQLGVQTTSFVALVGAAGRGAPR